MDNAGKDIPRQKPANPLQIDSVGVTRTDIPVIIRSPLEGSRLVTIMCIVKASLMLPSSARGIHVSRIGHIFANLAAEEFDSLHHYAMRLQKAISRDQGAVKCEIFVAGVLTYSEQTESLKRKVSLEHLLIRASVSGSVNEPRVSSGIGFNHITACPCVQETFRHSSDDNLSEGANKGPMFTHSQRCRTYIDFIGVDAPPSLPKLLEAIDSIVVRSMNTLPRDLELLSVHRAHVNAQFVEDILRDLAVATRKLVEAPTSQATVRVESTSFESIHDFDLHGFIEVPVS